MTRKTILFIIGCLSPLFFSGQTVRNPWGGLAPDTSFYYKKSYLSGNEDHGIRVGHWYEFGPDSVVYSEMNYDSAGNPCGAWKANFPDGNKRIVTDYLKGLVIKVTFYRMMMRVVEIDGSPFIPEPIYAQIRLFEDQRYQKDQTLRIIDRNGFRGRREWYWVPVHYLNFRKISEVLTKDLFTGSFLVWNENGDLQWKYKFNNGDETLTTYCYNGYHKLKKQEEYRKDTLIQIIKFNKKGFPVDTIKAMVK